MRKIDSFSLSIDKSDSFIRSNPFKYEFRGTSEPPAQYEKYKWILQEPVPTIIDKSQMIFGQPDAYDQCGYYIAYSISNNRHQALIDPEKVPKELETVIKRLFR